MEKNYTIISFEISFSNEVYEPGHGFSCVDWIEKNSLFYGCFFDGIGYFLCENSVAFHDILIRDQDFIKGRVGDTVSLLPIGGDVTGITTEGLEYPLQRSALKFGATLGISNVLTAPVARVQVESGLLLCVHISNHSKGGER